MNERSTERRPSAAAVLHATPRYGYPAGLVLSVAASILLGRKRAFHEDAARLLRTMDPPPLVEGQHWIPAADPFVVLMNHYRRPGYQVWWGTFTIATTIAQSRTIPGEILWISTNRWTYPDWLRSHLISPLSYWVFTRAAQVYGFAPMPAMPPNPNEVEQRARAVRYLLSLLAAHRERHGMIGYAPEGRDNERLDGSLIEPPPGGGRFLTHIARHGFHILPVGVAVVEGAQRVCFGPPFALGSWPHLSKDEQDRAASTQVMVAIGKLLPPALWGAYHTEIEHVPAQ